MAVAPGRALLLDLDGVVFRHPAAFARVHAQVAAFVRSRGVTAEAHERLYREHGHTLLGLRSLGDPSTVADFNREVFDAAFLEEVRRMPRPDDTERHSASVRRLVARARSRGSAVYIFTNAPRSWVNLALSVTGLGATFEEGDLLICEEMGFLKPQAEAYRAVEERTGASSFLLVDDSAINLLACSVPTWLPILFDPKPTCSRACAAAPNVVVADLEAVHQFV